MNQKRRHLLCALLVSCLVAGVLLFSVISVATATGPSPSAPLDCTDTDDVVNYTCNDGEGDDAFPLPDVVDQAYVIEAAAAGPILLDYRGVTLEGGECLGAGPATGEYLPVDNDAEVFIYRGMNTFKVPISHYPFEKLHLSIGLVNESSRRYIAKLKRFITSMATHGATVILELRTTNPNPGATQQVWANIARLFNQSNLIYSILHTRPRYPYYADRVRYAQEAVAGIRATEPAHEHHLLLMPAIDITNLDDADRVMEQYRAIPNSEPFTLGIIQSPTLLGNVMEKYMEAFVKYWPPFVAWTLKNALKIYLSEISTPEWHNYDQSLSHFLAAVHQQKYNGTYGFIGWSASNAGVCHCGNRDVTARSIAPGYVGNDWMWDPSLYSKYLRPLLTPVPGLDAARQAIRVRVGQVNFPNSLVSYLYPVSGYIPFQVRNAPRSIGNGDTFFLYSSNNYATPFHNLQLIYRYAWVMHLRNVEGLRGNVESAITFTIGFAVHNSSVTEAYARVARPDPSSVIPINEPYRLNLTRPDIGIVVDDQDCPIRPYTDGSFLNVGPRCYKIVEGLPYK